MNKDEELRQALIDCSVDEDSAEHYVESGTLDKHLALIHSHVIEAQEDRRAKNKSLCGCPMCEYHSQAYELSELQKLKDGK